jgi:hypothetical protein
MMGLLKAFLTFSNKIEIYLEAKEKKMVSVN